MYCQTSIVYKVTIFIDSANEKITEKLCTWDTDAPALATRSTGRHIMDLKRGDKSIQHTQAEKYLIKTNGHWDERKYLTSYTLLNVQQQIQIIGTNDICPNSKN